MTRVTRSVIEHKVRLFVERIGGIVATYDPERQRQAAQREAERARKQAVARQKELERQERQEYVARRKVEVERQNSLIDSRVAELDSFLVRGLGATEAPSLAHLRRAPHLPPLRLGALATAEPLPTWNTFAPPPPGFWKRSFGQAAIEQEAEGARIAFDQAVAAHAQREDQRQRNMQGLKRDHAVAVRREEEKCREVNSELDSLLSDFKTRTKAQVEEYLLLVVADVPAPRDFPSEPKIAFDPKSEQLVVEVELPNPECVPAQRSFKYVQARDEVTEVARTPRESASLYRHVVSSYCLLIVRSMFNADENLQKVSLNGRVRYVNPATGHEERPHILSMVVERDAFASLVLDRVKPEECLKHLRALVSPHPYELVAVEPLVEFDRSRLAFVQGLGVISGLDARPDLMAMSPTEFEHLISEVLAADPSIESVESLTTRQSNDGGVDGVVYIKQPFGRSMTVVQAKQYARNRNLGPAHIRELIGAMHEVKAGNGLLVTTSDFTAIARANAAEFGRIQLIDGNNLVHRIKKLLGKDVLIGEKRK